MFFLFLSPFFQGSRATDKEKQVWLRLERINECVSALCSADGKHWHRVGSVTFPVEGTIQVGMHAIGQIERLIYHGAYPDGTAIKFESFTMWQL